MLRIRPLIDGQMPQIVTIVSPRILRAEVCEEAAIGAVQSEIVLAS
jgi:hypothetical protein